MKKKIAKLKDTITIPENLDIKILENKITLSKGDVEISRKFNPLILVKKQDNEIILETQKDRKIEKKNFGTLKAHIKNIIAGFEKEFEYKLKIAFVHFPMNVSVNSEKDEIIIKNFLGEKTDRKLKIPKGVKVEINQENILVQSIDIEKAGQFAANLEKRTKVKNKDRRVFQDGIFIVETPKKRFL